MKLIDIGVFGGQLPAVQPKLLQPFQSVVAENTDLDYKDIRPYKNTVSHQALSKVGDIQTIYRFAATIDPDDGFWFHWTTDVDVAKGQTPGDTEETTYYTGDGAPKYTNAAIATSGGTDYPENEYLLGIPAPVNLISATKAGTPDAEADATDALARNYVYTYVNDRGEEGPPSPASAVLSMLPGEYAELRSIDGAPAGNYNIVLKNIYRLFTAGSSTEYQFVIALAIDDPDFDDYVLDSALGELLPSIEWESPVSDLFNLGILSNGIYYGLSKNRLCLSKPNLPHAWSPLDRQSFSYDPVSAGHFDNTIVVLTEKNPFLVTGTDPQSMTQDELFINQACLSKRSTVSTPYGVLFASPDGLILIGQQGYRNITKKIFNREQWIALKPDSIIGVFHDDRYIGFYDNGTTQGSFIIDPTDYDSGLRFSTVYAKHAYSDPLTDELLVLIGSAVHRFNAGSNLTYKWLSKVFEVTRPLKLTAARVTAETYADLTFRLYVDGALKATHTVTDGRSFRLVGGYEGRQFQVEVEGTDTVSRIEVGEVVGDLS